MSAHQAPGRPRWSTRAWRRWPSSWGPSWRAVPDAVVAVLRARRRAGGRVPPRGAVHRDHRGRARRRAARAVRAAAPRRGDPPPLHRADPPGPRRAGDPGRARRGGAQPGAARGRGAARSSTTSPGRRATISRWPPGPTCTGRRRAARRRRASLAVDVRLMDSSWGRLLAVALDSRLDDFDRVALERAALAVAIDLLGQQHDEQLRARSRGAFLSDLADGRVEEADARRRAEALGFPGAGRGPLLPVAASWRAPRYARGGGRRRGRGGGRRHLVDPPVRRPARRALLDRLLRPARPARRRPAGPARARPARVRRGAGRARRPPVPRRARPPRAGPERRRAGDRRAGGHLGRGRPGAAARAPLGRRGDRRSRSPAGTTPAAPASPTCCTTCATTPALDAFVDEQLGPLLADGSPRTRTLLETLEAYLAAGGRKAEAARALHLERQSLYLRLRRIEELLGVSLDDEDAVLGLHLAVRARRFRQRALERGQTQDLTVRRR